MNLKNLLSKILKTLEYYPFDKEMLLVPVDTSSILIEQLNFLIGNKLIRESKNPRQGWCGGCDTVCDIEYKDNKKYFVCWECGGHETINNTNLIKYSTSITALISFLQNILELNKENEVIVDNRLLYIGSKGIEKYYLFHKIYERDSNDLIKHYIKYPDSFVLTLVNNHTIQTKTYTLLDYFVFKKGNCILDLPKINYKNLSQSKGGKIKTEKYSEVRNFIINEFNREEALDLKTTLQIKYKVIADRIRNNFPKNIYYTANKPKEKKGHWWLKDDNLERYVQDTIKIYIKNKKSLAVPIK